MPYFRQLLHDQRGCISYIIGCPGHGVWAVVDPQEDVEQYLKLAEREGYRITHVLETHIHADHVSGGRKLAERTGADIYLHRSAEVKYDFVPLKDGQVLKLGNQRIKVLHTPGHTPEHVCYLHNQFLLTGDALFAGSVGRVDFEAVSTPEQLYHSLFDKILKLDDFLAIMPAHYGKSPCGAGLSPVSSSTLGFEKRFNAALQAKSREEFVRQITGNPPPPLKDYARIRRINMGLES